MPLHIVLAFILLIAAYKFGDWRNWKSYYSTMLFWGFGDLIYRFLFTNRALWMHYSKYFSERQIELIWIVVIYPCTLLLLLPNYLKQKSLMNHIYYLLSWIAGFSILEFILHKSGLIIYSYGWNLYWSIGFYFFMFPILVLHHFRPLWAIFISSICGMALMYMFIGSLSV